MNAQEFDTALSDLETRVDRLRALYENWFRGYEKMEPAVARKDVERRVYALRKELPRNTALRFRYHQLYQRYTTLATYWQRTARQIEEGTYRLQLQRMKRRRVDDDDARTMAPRPRGSEEGDSVHPPSYELSLDASLDVRALLDEIDLDHVAKAIDVPGPHEAWNQPPLAPAARMAGQPSITPAGSLRAPAREPGQASLAPAAHEASPSLPAPAAARSTARFSRPSLETDATPSVAPRMPEGAVPKPAQTFAKPQQLKVPPLAPPAMLSRASLASGPGTGQLAIPPLPGAKAPLANPPAGAARPAAPAPALGGGPPLAPPPRPSIPQPGRPTAAPAPAASAASVSASMSEQRMRRIYDEYAAARRKNNEGDVRYETLANSIQKMLPDLSKKHGGKQIDFEIVLKDGRVGLKPKAT